jgi:hypothetical protein
MILRLRSGRVYAKATRARQTGPTGVSCWAAVVPNRTLWMNSRRESHIAAMTDRLEPAQKPVHTAVPDGEMVKVAFTERRDVKAGALIRTLTGPERALR